MNVGLITDDVIGQTGQTIRWKTTGVGRYAQELHRGLLAQGISADLIYAKPPSIPPREALKHVVSMPRAVCREVGRFDVIHATSPITALAFPAISKPKVVTYHDLVSLGGGTTGTSVVARLFAPLFLRVGYYADAVIANSLLTKAELTSHIGIPPTKIRVVHLGVADVFQRQRKVRDSTFVIGYVGALNPRKGLPFLVRTVRILLDRHSVLPLRLEICGSLTHHHESLRGLVAELGLDEITEFKAALTDEQLAAAYNSFDILVLPSEWEGFGLPILEAQRCGVPVIVRKDAHIPEEVSTCCLKAASEEDMADKIYQLLTDSGMRLSVTEQGLDYSSQFTWHRTVRQTVEVYEELLARA